MKRKFSGFVAGMITAVVGYYLMLMLVLSIWGLDAVRWVTFTTVAVPIGVASAVSAWVIRGDRGVLIRAFAMGLTAGFVVAVVADMFVDSLELSIAGAALVLGIEAWLLDVPSSSQPAARQESVLD